MTEYAAGTVAEVTFRGKRYRAFRTGVPSNPGWEIAIPEQRCWTADKGGYVTDVQPLIVLDFGPGKSPTTDAVSLLRSGGVGGEWETFLDWLAGQIEAQTKPPRIPEPGLYGVVEATVDGADRRRFCHLEDDGEGWSGAGAWFYWRDLTYPKLIRPGIEDES